MPNAAMGIIYQINISDGGVPKLPVAEAEITAEGVTGDRQRNRRFHGGPRRAVCLFSLDVIERLRAEGHPIAPGTVGENITVVGMDWSRVRPGVRLRLGDDVLLEVTAYTVPCANIAASFRERDVSRISVKRAPGESRVYARVLAPGRVRPGDPVAVVGREEGTAEDTGSTEAGR